MAAYIGYLRMIWAGMGGAGRELRAVLKSKPHRMVLRSWAALLLAGAVNCIPLWVQWPENLVAAVFALIADYGALKVMYAVANWFYLHGRQHEAADQTKKRGPIYAA